MNNDLQILIVIALIAYAIWLIARGSSQVTVHGTIIPQGRVNSDAMYDQYVIAAVANKALPSDSQCRENDNLHEFSTRVLLAKAYQLQTRAPGGLVRAADRDSFAHLSRRLIMRGKRISLGVSVSTSHPFASYQQFQLELQELARNSNHSSLIEG